MLSCILMWPKFVTERTSRYRSDFAYQRSRYLHSQRRQSNSFRACRSIFTTLWSHKLSASSQCLAIRVRFNGVLHLPMFIERSLQFHLHLLAALVKSVNSLLRAWTWIFGTVKSRGTPLYTGQRATVQQRQSPACVVSKSLETLLNEVQNKSLLRFRTRSRRKRSESSWSDSPARRHLARQLRNNRTTLHIRRSTVVVCQNWLKQVLNIFPHSL